MNAPALTPARPVPLMRQMFSAFNDGLSAESVSSDNDVYREQKPSHPAYSSFSTFNRTVLKRYEETPFHKLLDDKLEQVARYIETGSKEGIGRLMIFMPPRHGKTLKVSRLFPAWFIGRNPDERMIMASYGALLANRNSRYVRNLLNTPVYKNIFPKISLSTASVSEWDIADRDGGAIAAGIGGGITGHGAKLLIIDDPIKSRSEAESETYRESLKEWYGDAYTRLEEPGAAVILMHTRWHTDDLAGHLLKESTDDWTVLCLPALAEGSDPLGRAEGEALWPERYPIEKLEKVRQTLGDYRFGSEYGQKPVSKSGALFDTQLIEVIDYEPECVKIVRFYDMAITEKRRADYTAGVKLGVTKDEEFIIFHVYREQKEAPDVQEDITQNAAIDGPGVEIRLEAEKAGIIQLQYLLRDARMRPYFIDAVPPQGDKYTRAGPVAVRVKARRVKMVRGPWNRAFIEELSMFPKGKNDDQVDGFSGAYDMLSDDRSHGGIHF